MHRALPHGQLGGATAEMYAARSAVVVKKPRQVPGL